MFTYKVRTEELTPYLPQANQENVTQFGANVEVSQPLTREFPCGAKIQLVRNGERIELETVACGTQDIALGTTALCDTCHSHFKEAKGESSDFTFDMYEYFTPRPLSLFEKAKRFAKDHPYLTLAAVAFPVVCGLIAYGASPAAPSALGQEGDTVTPNATATPETEATTFLTTTALAKTTSLTEPAAPSTTTTPAAKPTTSATLPTTKPTTKSTTKPVTTTKTTTTTTQAAKTTTKTTTQTPDYSVSVDASLNHVVLTARKVAPISCFKEVYRQHIGRIEVTNNCGKSLVAKSATGATCVFAAKSGKQYCYTGTDAVDFRLGYSDLSFTTTVKGTLTARVTNNGELTVNVPFSVNIPLQGTSTCMQRTDFVRKTTTDPVTGHTHTVSTPIFSNTCEDPVLFTIFERGKGQTTSLMQPRAKKTLPEGAGLHLREVTKVPKLIQKFAD